MKRKPTLETKTDDIPKPDIQPQSPGVIIPASNKNPLSSLRSYLQCPVCMEASVDRFVPCGHSFCTNCLRKIFEHQLVQMPMLRSFICPQCRSECMLKQPNVIYQSNDALAEFYAESFPVNYVAQQMSNSLLGSYAWCQEHVDYLVDCWCWSCMKELCAQCTPKHQEHTMEMVEDAFKKACGITQESSERLAQLKSILPQQMERLKMDKLQHIRNVRAVFQKRFEQMEHELSVLERQLELFYDAQETKRVGLFGSNAWESEFVTMCQLESRSNSLLQCVSATDTTPKYVSWLKEWNAWYNQAKQGNWWQLKPDSEVPRVEFAESDIKECLGHWINGKDPKATVEQLHSKVARLKLDNETKQPRRVRK